MPLIVEILGLCTIAYGVGFGAGWLLFGRGKKEGCLG